MASVLAASRQATLVAQTTVAPNLHQPTDVSVDFTLQVAFYLVVGVQNFTNFGNLRLGQVPHLDPRVKAGFFKQTIDVVFADAIDQRQGVLDCLIPWKVDTRDSCHTLCSVRVAWKALALTLLVLGNDADHPHHSVAFDDLALVADLFDAGPYFHV